nr:MarR family transcriptional regulator [Pseudonocardia spinosispora]
MAVAAGLRRVTRRRLRLVVGNPRLRGAQLELLQLVEAEPGIGVAAAARALHLAGNSVSTLVNQLSEAGLLHRAVDPADRRAARLALTEKAQSRLDSWRRERGRLVGSALDRLSAADRDAIDAALPALHRLMTELEDTAS